MPVSLPTAEQLKRIADQMNLSLTDADAASFLALMKPSIDGYNVVDQLPDNLPPVKYPRTPGQRPQPEENPYNAWYYKSRIEGAPQGRLKGKTVVIKDNVMVAGVPMMNGASTLEGYMPEVDATVVTRILDAGGTILGKAHCEYYCLSGGSHTNATGPVHNPYRKGYSAGGSSSGSAVLVALGEADMAIGGDQGGSIRMPASFCGIYGMKPTHALLLEAIAGPDGYDPRQYAPRVQPYTQLLSGGAPGLRIGVVKEGFGLPQSEAVVDAKVRQAADLFKRLGATVSDVSIPAHLLAGALWLPIGIEGLTQTMMWGDGYGVSRQDLYVTSLMDFQRGWRQRADELSETTKLFTMLGTYIHQQHGSRYYGKAMNITRRLTAAYDAALADCDLLLMPTTPMKAQPMPGPGAPREEIVGRALEMITNTAPFDITHHPAMAVPCGMADGLPVSVMLVGKHWDEPTIYRAAHAFERAGDWKAM
jgi:amidase